jgi:MjaI restriction endonuclease.
MNIEASVDSVYQKSSVPQYSWEKYQRGFLGILNNSYNQSCNCGKPKLGVMNEIEEDFILTHGGGSWQEFVRFYIKQYNGHDRIQKSIEYMMDNLQSRVESIGGSLDADDARFWSRKYVWSMIVNTYTGFCSERTAIEHVARGLDLPYTTHGNESAGIDGKIGSATVQVKPDTHMGLDLNDYSADYVITYHFEDDVFVFDVPDELLPQS